MVTCSAERLIKQGARWHDAAKWQMFNHILPVLQHCVDAARGCRCIQARVVIAMITVTSYDIMSVDDLQMLGVHVRRDPNQGQERLSGCDVLD